MVHFHNLFPEGRRLLASGSPPRTFYRDRRARDRGDPVAPGRHATTRRWFDSMLAFRLCRRLRPDRRDRVRHRTSIFRLILPRWRSASCAMVGLRRLRRRHDRGAGSCRLSIRRHRRVRARSRQLRRRWRVGPRQLAWRSAFSVRRARDRRAAGSLRRRCRHGTTGAEAVRRQHDDSVRGALDDALAGFRPRS